MNIKLTKNRKGFSLVEVLIAMGIFTIVAGTAFQLYSRHQALFSQEQDIVSLSLSLRNALNQIQTDMSNAGTGVFPGANVPNFPIGLTVINNPGGGCYDAATQTYQASCFDGMHILTADSAVQPVHPTTCTGAAMTTTSGQVCFLPPTNPALTAAQAAALYRANDVVLFVRGDGSRITAVQLTANGAVNGARVQLSFTPTAADGTGNDPYEITTNPNANLLSAAYSATDWLVKLNAVSYSVDTATDPQNPRLVRTQAGQTDVVTDQIVGFRVGVSLWNQVLASSTEAYNFDASTYGDPPGASPFDYTLIRSVRLLLVGRTRPNFEASYRFRNLFDQGPYQIQPVSLVVNPRNLSLKD